MAQFQKLLTLSLIPTVIFLILSLVSVILTTHYWILTDYFVGRLVLRPSTFPERKKFPIDKLVMDYTEPSTNATITSGCLCLAAAVYCVIACVKLKAQAMDLDYNAPLRRAWVGSAIFTALVGMCAAIASLATHFTDKGPDEYGCFKTTGKTKEGGEPFTNLQCSRLVATCDFMGPLYDRSWTNVKKWAITISCNEATAVKWLQAVLIVNAAVVIAMFAAQAGVRRKDRTPLSKGL